MKRIGILSDTHSYWDDKYLHYFEPCDEIWHAGDIGSVEVAEKLAAFRPFRAVCGNCDGGDLRLMYRELNRFKVEDVDVLIKHIGGYPGNYDSSVRSTLFANPPQLSTTAPLDSAPSRRAFRRRRPTLTARWYRKWAAASVRCPPRSTAPLSMPA